jgi:3-oxoacyl-[acyl-carrier-protein] synthase II
MRVFVTGVGMVSPLARGADATMDLLMEGRSAFGPVTLFDVKDQRSRIAAEVAGFSALAALAEAPAWSRTDAMAVEAAREALTQAGVQPGGACDLVVGGTTGGMFETEELLADMWRDADRRTPLRSMLSHPLSATSDRMQDALGPFGRARTLCSACSGGANAIALGAEWIRAGESERVLAGGADGLCRLTFTGFNALAAVSTEECRPFDRRRSGLRLGEGAAFVVLESERSLDSRGGEAIAELSGWGIACEALHITHPEPSGATAAALIARALAGAGMAPGDLDYVNAHGTGTVLNDAMEAAALHRALGADARRVPVSSVKGQIGHTLGAAGAIEAVVTVLSIVRGEIPPTGGLERPDPDCDLVHVQGTGRRATVRAAMSNSFGFGGSDTVLIFTRARTWAPRAQDPPRRIVVSAATTLGPLGLLSARESRAYLEPGVSPDLVVPPETLRDLHVARARKMDRAARLLSVAMGAALRSAGGADPPSDGPLVGAVCGSAYGTVDASAEFMRRTYDKGPRLASPAAFPNLVPSSPVGHAAIYLGLRGPVLAAADLGVSGEAAFATAYELLRAGHAELMLAASLEERSVLTQSVLGPVCSASDGWLGGRSEGVASLLLETEVRARGRGHEPLAVVRALGSGRGAVSRGIGSLPRPSGRTAQMITARLDAEVERALATTSWRDVARAEVAPRAGHHEGLGGFALVCAAGVLAARQADEVLVFGVAPDRFFWVLLERA